MVSFSAFAQSTIDPALPAAGQPYSSSVIRGQFDSAYSDINTLYGLNKCAPASTAPANPVRGTCWLNTSSSIWAYNLYDDIVPTWITIFSIDSTNGLNVPPIGGGTEQTLASSSTVDLGSVPQSLIQITGTNTISSFGSSAKAGQAKLLYFSGVLTLSQSSALELPGNSNLTTGAGDTAIAVATGSSNWLVISYQRATGGPVTLTFAEVVAALGYTPLNPANNLSDVASGSIATTNITAAPHVANQTALTASCVGASGCPSAHAIYAVGVWRDAYAASAQSFPVFYEPSGSACSLNAGSGDGGSQVSSADGKCWIADLQGIKPTPLIWGAVGNGTADDTVAVQSAINALQNATLYTGPSLFKLTSGVTSSGKISIIGEYANDNTTSKGGFRAGAQNLNLITLSAGDSAAQGLYIDMGANGVNTSGSAFVATNGANSKFSDNTISQPCIAFDVSNVGWVQIDHNQTLGARGSTCSVVRLGNSSTGANTIGPRITNNTWSIDQTNPSGSCLLVEDAGGVYYRNNDCVYSVVGVAIRPGVNQQVLWGFYQGVLGDTSGNIGLSVDTSDPSAEIRGNDFDQTWTASAANSCVVLRNNGGGTVAGFHFRGHRSYACGLHGFDIGGGVTYTSIDDSNICGNGTQGGNTGDGIAIGAGVSLVFIRGNTISNTCDGFTGTTQAYAISFLGTNGSIIISGNFLAGNNLGTLTFTNPLSASSRIVDNVGFNPAGAGTLTPGASPWTLTASAIPTSYYFTGGTVSSITQGGVTIATASPAQIYLGPNESVVVTYSGVPTVTQFEH